MGIEKIDSDFARQETPQFILPLTDFEMKPTFAHHNDIDIMPEDITSIGVVADKNAEVSRAMVSVNKKMIKNLSDSVTSQGRLKLGELIDQIFELGLDLSGQGI